MRLLAACIPAVLAATMAAASWAIGALSAARRTALRDALKGGRGRALDRYLRHRLAIESRWLVLRALGIGLTAVLVAREIPGPIAGWHVLVSAFVATIAYAVPSEIARGLAARDPERAAPLLLRALQPIEILAAPVSAPILWVTRLLGGGEAQPPAAPPGVIETEVEMIVKEGEADGSIGPDESAMIRNVLEFRDVTAGDVMLPRTRVTALSADVPLEEALRRVAEGGHSRYPVYRGSIDNVVGLLYAKDLLKAAAGGDTENRSLEGLLRNPVAFVPESQLASSVLKDMRAGRHHMAIVIDEFGGVAGVVTLEDLLEEIVGDIRDEHDSREPPIVDLGGGRLVVDASVPIGDLGRYLGADLPDDEDYNSLAGFIIARLGRVPEVGARLSALGLNFSVLEADERRVVKVEITRLAPPESVLPPPTSSRVSAA